MWAIEIQGDDGVWSPCGEGPWQTRDGALAFGLAEVGMPWRVVKRTLHERCESLIRGWDQWSPAELAKMDAVVEEVMHHIINGGGNRFVQEFVNRHVVPFIPGFQAR